MLFNNRWVIPYDIYLLQKYDCHINVEICSDVKVVKYLYKYVYKAHDRAAMYIAYADGDNIINEIEIFQEARWVSAPETIWRLFEFQMNDIYLAFINLHLRLPNQQLVPYPKDVDLREILN